MKQKLPLLLLSLFLTCSFLLPGLLLGQDTTDVSEEEIEERRNALIEAGYLQEISDQLTLQSSASVESLLQHASYMSKNASFSTVDSRATDFRPNGSRFYILGRDSENVAEYQVSSSWDIESTSFVRELNVSPEVAGSPVTNGLYIRKDNGQQMWVFNRTEIWEYTLSTAWDVSSATQTGYKDLSGYVVRGHDIDFRPNGRVLYVDDRDLGVVFQFNLSTAWDVETATLDYTLDISNRQQEVRGIQLSSDGDRMFLMDTGRREILEYYLSTPFNLRSASFLGSFSVSSQTSNPRGLTFRPDLSMFYVTSASNNRVYQYRIRLPKLSTPEILAASHVTETGFRANWESVSSASNYRLQVSSSSNFSSSNIVDETNVNGTHYNVTGLPTNRTYHYRVRAQSSSAITEDSDYSDSESVRIVTADSDESGIAASPGRIPVFGGHKSIITVTVHEANGDPIQGMNVTLSADGGSSQIETIRGTSNSNGLATFEVSNNTPERVTYRAQAGNTTINQTAAVTFFTADADESSVAANPVRVLAFGGSKGIVTVTVRDDRGETIEGARVTLSADGGSSQIETVQGTSNSNGRATFEVSNNTAEQVEYRAVAENVQIAETATVTFVTADPDESSVVANPASVQADGEDASTITITVRDDEGNELQGASVMLSQGGGASEIIAMQDVTDSNGEAVYAVTNTTAQQVTYIATAADITITENVEVIFIPRAPVALEADPVGADTFTAKWELVPGDDLVYLLDVATDEGFNNMVDGFNGRDVGNRTDFEVSGVAPGSTLYYRVRGAVADLEGANSDVVEVHTFPDEPVALDPGDVSVIQFTAMWEPAEGADEYLLDVSDTPDFSSFVGNGEEVYEALNAGSDTSWDVRGLLAGETYYYRVRSKAVNGRLSSYSNRITAETVRIDPGQSDVTANQLRVLADGMQENEVTVIVRGEDGADLRGVPVTLQIVDESGRVQKEIGPGETDAYGEVRFEVSHDQAGLMSLKAHAVNVEVGEFKVTFVSEDDFELTLQDNYPNPFNFETILPFTIPERMHVRLEVANVLGAIVQTLIDEPVERGFHEIVFDATGLASGIYFYRLITEEKVLTEKMILVR